MGVYRVHRAHGLTGTILFTGRIGTVMFIGF